MTARPRSGLTRPVAWFLPLTAQLDPPSLPSQSYYPEYDRLYGVGTTKSQLVVYSFHGVDTDETNPDDIFGQEAIKFFARSSRRSQTSGPCRPTRSRCSRTSRSTARTCRT